MSMKLKAAREASGKTQSQVAKEARITVRGYRKIEAKEEYKAVKTAILIAKALGTTVEALWGGNPTEEKPGGNQCRVGSSERPTR